MSESLLVTLTLRSCPADDSQAVYLTSVGGGVFGNDPSWICDAIQRALDLFRAHPLDVYLVHFRGIAREYTALV